MNRVNIGESSSGMSVYPVKRRRGRPRKDPNLKHAGAKQYLHQRADRTDGTNSMVGHTVTGVVEATFDAGYVLTVRIGGSTMNLRGVVLKPGHYSPVKVENDVAPHLQMIRRNDIRFPTENQGWSSHSQKLDIQAPGTVPSKRRQVPLKTAPSSAPPVGVRGTVVPVVLQPVNFPNGSSQIHSDTSQSTHTMSFGDKDVHMVEPLAMLPPDRSIPVSQIFLGTQPPHTSHQIEKHDSIPFNQDLSEVGKGENVKSMGSTDAHNSSDISDNQTENSKEEHLKSSDIALIQKTGNTNKPMATEILQTASITKPPLFCYGAGRMTELLQAVQENMKENQTDISEQPVTASEAEFHTNDHRN